jgi:hypothetical protein
VALAGIEGEDTGVGRDVAGGRFVGHGFDVYVAFVDGNEEIVSAAG